MIARTLSYILAAIVGVCIGITSALYLAGLWTNKQPMEFGGVNVNGWVSDFAVGSEQASPYVRARIARHGLLALAQSEAVYFVRSLDDEGQPLVENCQYRVSGGAMPADWWSVTLYQTPSSMLPLNEDAALSVDATSIEAEGEQWQAMIAPARPEQADNWISSRGAGNFDLLLRLYVPSADLLAEPNTTLAPPSVERIACDGGVS